MRFEGFLSSKALSSAWSARNRLDLSNAWSMMPMVIINQSSCLIFMLIADLTGIHATSMKLRIRWKLDVKRLGTAGVYECDLCRNRATVREGGICMRNVLTKFKAQRLPRRCSAISCTQFSTNPAASFSTPFLKTVLPKDAAGYSAPLNPVVLTSVTRSDLRVLAVTLQSVVSRNIFVDPKVAASPWCFW